MANQIEGRIQSECFKWHWNNCPEERRRLFLVHNNPRNKRDGARLVAMGMVAGVSDLIYIDSAGVAHFLEFKTPAGSMSLQQRSFRDAITKTGAKYVVIRSVDEFKEYIKKIQDGG